MPRTLPSRYQMRGCSRLCLYNRVLHHSSPGYLRPTEYEQVVLEQAVVAQVKNRLLIRGKPTLNYEAESPVSPLEILKAIPSILWVLAGYSGRILM